MAKAKKKEALSLEEMLEQALVPVDEQPYEVPENWCWVKHNSILDISGGSQPAKSHFISEPAEGYTQLYQTRDYGENPVPVYIPDKYATKTTKEGDILLARYGGSLGKVFRAHEGAYNVALAKVIKLYPELIDDEFLFKYYLAQFYQNFCIKASSGRSAQAGFNREDMDSIPFPLPPLAEQQRIVEQIESLFAKLDEAKEKIQITVEDAERNKSAILQEAFTGKLTSEWRSENNYTDNEWKSVTLGDVLVPVKDKYEPNGNIKLNIPYIGLEHIEKGKGICSQGSPDEVKSLKTLFKKGDLLYGKLRPYLNKHDVAEFDGMCSTDILAYRADNVITAKYMNYLLGTINFMEYAMEHSSGINLPRTSEKAISAYKMKISSIAEQEEIVRILDTVLEKQDTIISSCKNVLEQIELMKKSILAKAFRGELGTNNPDEESAVKLLKQIIAENL